MEVIQYRAIQDDGMKVDMENRSISGYGIVFNSDSTPMPFWDDRTGKIYEVVEQITPDSLKGADMRDVISAFNHDFDKVLGRTTSGTMTLTIDKKGVKYRAKAPQTSYANDVLELLRRGDLSGSSFVFTMDWDEGYKMEERADGTIVAIPKKIKRVYEMGPVISPAYPETTAENRSMMLEKAVKRFLNDKAELQKRDETPKGEDVKKADEKPQEDQEQREEQKPIEYPLTVTYKAKAKVMKQKNKRV